MLPTKARKSVQKGFQDLSTEKNEHESSSEMTQSHSVGDRKFDEPEGTLLRSTPSSLRDTV